MTDAAFVFLACALGMAIVIIVGRILDLERAHRHAREDRDLLARRIECQRTVIRDIHSIVGLLWLQHQFVLETLARCQYDDDPIQTMHTLDIIDKQFDEMETLVIRIKARSRQ